MTDFDDDFLKEIENASSLLKEEFENINVKKSTETPQSGSIKIDDKPKEKTNEKIPENNFENEMKQFQDILGNLMKSMDFGSSKEEDKFQIFEKLNNELSDLEKKINSPSKDEAKQTSNANSNNPFVDAFKEISGNEKPEDFLNSIPGMKDLFNSVGDLGKNEGKDPLDGVSDLMKILGKISETDEKNPNQGNGDEMKFMFEQLFDVLVKDDILSQPLTSIQTKLKEYCVKNKDKITSEEHEKYNSIDKHITEVLDEIKKPNPNKEFIINIFSKLQTEGELPSEIMSGADDDLMKNFKNILGN